MSKLALKVETNEAECKVRHFCSGGSVACLISCQSWCALAQRFQEAASTPCPVTLGLDNVGCEKHGKCDIPEYRALVRNGASCGGSGKCFLLEVLKDVVPPQDFKVTDSFPKGYEGPRMQLPQLQRILRSAGM